MDRASETLPTLSSWVRGLWTRVLFPGPPPAAEGGPRLLCVALLVAVPALLLYPFLGFRLFERAPQVVAFLRHAVGLAGVAVAVGLGVADPPAGLGRAGRQRRHLFMELGPGAGVS